MHVSVKRLGGGFGGKIDQCNMVSTATAVAAQKMRRPVRVQLELSDNMRIVGGREPYMCTYKAGVPQPWWCSVYFGISGLKEHIKQMHE